MQFFDEMCSTLGFDGGEVVPAGAEKFREVYVEAVNSLAGIYGSKFKAFIVNGSGAQNWCMIGFGKDTPKTATFGTVPVDLGMQKAIRVAQKLKLDDMVNVVATFVPGHREKLVKLIDFQVGKNREAA